MKLGDTVRSKNSEGQIQIEGTLVGMIESSFYLGYMVPKDVDPGVTWSKKCPNWKEEPICIVFFNIPQRTATLEEWVETGVLQGYRREDLEKNYERRCPVVQSVTFPAADLEVV